MGAEPTLVPAAPSPLPSRGPADFGRYQVLEELGRGGMGVVYRAHDKTLGRDVALKVLQVGGRVDAETLGRFEREARAAAALDHPNIVRVHDVGALPNGSPYYTMELLAGHDLAHAIADGSVAPREAVEAVRQVSLALLYAHQKGILHRDLKPQNIFLRRAPALAPISDAPTVNAAGLPRTGDGAPVRGPGRPSLEVHALLLDFGLAKLAERDLAAHAEGSEARKSIQSLTRSGEIFGTPAYMPPEQTLGAKDVDARADLYSLGAALYHALAGRPPFDAASLADLLVKVQRQDPLPPSEFNADVDADLDTLTLKCLQKDPKDRYQNAGDLAEDLKRWLDGDPISARPIGFVGRVWRKARRNRAVAIPIALLAVVSLAEILYMGAVRGTHFFAVRSQRAAAERALVAARGRAPSDHAGRTADLAVADDAASQLRRLEPEDMEVVQLFNEVKSEIAVLAGDRDRQHYQEARAELRAKQEDLRGEETRAKESGSHAGKARLWGLQREIDDLGRKFEQQFAAAVSEYGNAVGYWKDNPAANERLAGLYWERFQDAEEARDARGQEAYRGLVLQYAAKLSDASRRKFEGLLRGERDVRVTFWLPKGYGRDHVDLYLFSYERNRVPPVLVPVPFSLKEGKVLDKPNLSDAEPLRLDRIDATGRDPRPSQERLDEMKRRAVQAVGQDQAAAALSVLEDLARYEAVDADSLVADAAFAPLRDDPSFQALLAALRGEVPRRHVRVESIVAGSQAETLGLHAGDVLLRIAASRVWSVAPAQAGIQAKKEGETSEIEMWGPGGRRQVTAAGGSLGVKLAQVDLRRHDPRSVADVRWGSLFPLARQEGNLARLHPQADAPSGRSALHFRATLPKGSYLLYAPAGQGLYETRYPFEVARDTDWVEECELVAEDEHPPLPPALSATTTGGSALTAAQYWVYVPAGPYHASGDRDAQQSPARGAQRLRVSQGDGVDPSKLPRATEGLFLGRIEATSDTYLAYLNDRAWHIVEKARNRAPCAYGEPRETGGYWQPDAQGVFQRIQGWRDDWPICAVSWDDAIDFCAWATAQLKSSGSDWTLELPTEDEWEKAARGADGRFFPWGDDFDPTFCRMQDSRVQEQDAMNPEPGTLFPLDEGPYGVRDLGGSMREWTATVAGGQGQWRMLKGGAWSGSSSICRSAVRNGLDPRNFYGDDGFRFVARRARH